MGRCIHMVLGTKVTSLVYDSCMSCNMLIHDLLFMIYVSVIDFTFLTQLVLLYLHVMILICINYSFVTYVCSCIYTLQCHNLYSCMSYIASLIMHILLLSYLHEFVLMDHLLAMTIIVGM